MNCNVYSTLHSYIMPSYKVLNSYYIYYYRFIVHFPIGLDFLFKTFILHFFLSWTSSLSISSTAISSSTLSNHVLLGLPIGLLPSTPKSIHFFTKSLITFPHHMSIPSQSTTSNDSCDRLNSNQTSSFVLLSFMEIPHTHLIICISALSNFNPTSTSKGLVSLL